MSGPGPRTRTGAPGRLVGVDLARGTAVLGMFVAHVYRTRTPAWDDPGSWIGIAYGPSSILFAVLAGVSTGLLTGRQHPPQEGPALLRARLVVFTRAALLFALGGLVQLLVVDVAVILEHYAVLLVLCIPLLRWPPRRLLALAAVLVVVVNPVFHLVLEPWVRGGTYGGGALGGLAVTGNYPVVVWSAFVVTGLALGRCDLGAARVRLRVLAGGASAALVGYVVLPWAGTVLGADGYRYVQSPTDPSAVQFSVPWQTFVPPAGNLLWPEPHSGTPAEVVGSGGLVIALLAVLLLAGEHLGLVLLPLAALGSMPLTAYCTQLVALAAVGFTMTRPDGGLVPLLWFVGAALVAATAWSLLVGRGPLEQVVAAVCRRAADVGRPSVTTTAPPSVPARADDPPVRGRPTPSAGPHP